MKNFKFKIRGNYLVELEQEVSKVKTPKLVRAKMPESSEDANIKSKVGKLVKAPLPGTILKIKFKIGDTVKPGDILYIMEAMKMENNIQSETSGKIKSIMVAEGETVLQNDIIMEIE